MILNHSFFLQLLGLSRVVYPESKTKWAEVTNQVMPGNALFVGDVAFCEVFNAAKDSYVTGTMAKTAKSCEYELNGEFKSSTTFNVLTTLPGFQSYWKYSDRQPPVGAVKCNEGANCYIGQSVYGDGICKELPGKIFYDPVKQRSKITTVNKGKVYDDCTLNVYLVEA